MPGNKGPNPAGRARKNVELSSVNLMIAEGGKRDMGAWNENKARNRLDRDSSPKLADSASRGCAVRRERKVRKVGNAMKLRRRTSNRGGRIFVDIGEVAPRASRY